MQFHYMSFISILMYVSNKLFNPWQTIAWMCESICRFWKCTKVTEKSMSLHQQLLLYQKRDKREKNLWYSTHTPQSCRTEDLNFILKKNEKMLSFLFYMKGSGGGEQLSQSACCKHWFLHTTSSTEEDITYHDTKKKRKKQTIANNKTTYR